MNLRFPNIDAAGEKAQLQQIRSYLYQLAGELNWALSHMDRQVAQTADALAAAAGQKDAAQQAQASFSEVKALIIKSADIVNAYYAEINRRLEGQYVAVSDFGTYQQETAATLDASSERVQLLFENQQTLQLNVDGMGEELESIAGVLQTDSEGTTILGSQAWCRIGVLAYEDSGFPIYGMEIGQVNTEDGEAVYTKFAQYRSDGVHLFDQNGIEVATISDYKLRITNAEIINANITGSLKLGGYTIRTDNGLAFKWEGR